MADDIETETDPAPRRPGVIARTAGGVGAGAATPFVGSKTMLAEMIVGILVVTVGAIRSKQQVHFATFAWWAFMWWLIALASMFRPLAKVASGFGALITLAVCVRYGPAALGLSGGEKPKKITTQTYEQQRNDPNVPKSATGDPYVDSKGHNNANGPYTENPSVPSPNTVPGQTNIVPRYF